MKRNILAMLLAAMLLVPALASCGGGEADETAPDTSTNDVSGGVETEADLFADYRNIDLGGRTVNISVSANVTEAGAGMPTSYPYIAGPEELTGESVQDNVFQRNLEVEEMLNCELNHTATDLNFDEVQPHVETMVMSGDASVDYYINDQYGLLFCGVKGLLADLADSSQFQYLTLDGDMYYTEYNDQLAIGEKRFLITGDYFIDTMRAAHILYWNKNLYGDMYSDQNGLYDIVLDGKWTLPLFNEIITEAYVDLNGDGTADAEDQFGLSGHAGATDYVYYTFYYSTDSRVIEFDSDRIPYISEDNLETMSKMSELLIATDTSIGMYATADVGASLQKFVNGQSLFTMFQKVGDMEQASIRDFDGMGVVPYPKMDESQEIYRTLVHDTAELCAFPLTTVGEAASAASAVIQVMSVHAHEYLLEDYYEVALKSKYAQDAYTAQMLDLVVQGISAPFEFAYELGYSTNSYFNKITFEPVYQSIVQGTDVTASTFASLRDGAETKMQELIDAYID